MPKPSQLPDLQEILAQADPADVQNFLWKQAKRTVSLEVKLRAAFIRETDTVPGTNKYTQVLGILLKYNVHGKIRLTKRSVQLLREVCEQFVALQSDLLANTELREAWDAGYAILSQLHNFMDRYHGPDERLIAALKDTCVNLKTLLQQSPAPELREDVRTGLAELASRNPHVIYDLGDNVITCLYEAAASEPEKQAVREVVKGKVNDPGLLSPLQQRYWGALLVTLPGTSTDVLESLTGTQIYDVAHLLNVAGESRALKRLVRSFPQIGALSPPLALQWVRWKFDFAAGDALPEELLATGIELLRRDPRIMTWRRIREEVPYDKLQHALQSSFDDGFRADIYAEESEWKSLEDVIKNDLHLDLFVRFCHALSGNSSDFESLATYLVLNYPVHHGGPECALLVSRAMEAIRSAGRRDFATTLARKVTDEFPGRFEGMQKGAKKVKVVGS